MLSKLTGYVKIALMNERIVFMGSPDFSVPILQGLAESYNVVGVVSQPDRPSGRGRVLTPPPVKILATELGIPIMQPEKLRLPEAFEQLVSWRPNVIIVAAFGQILRQNVLDLPPISCINVHASYLPPLAWGSSHSGSDHERGFDDRSFHHANGRRDRYGSSLYSGKRNHFF